MCYKTLMRRRIQTFAWSYVSRCLTYNVHCARLLIMTLRCRKTLNKDQRQPCYLLVPHIEIYQSIFPSILLLANVSITKICVKYNSDLKKELAIQHSQPPTIPSVLWFTLSLYDAISKSETYTFSIPSSKLNAMYFFLFKFTTGDLLIRTRIVIIVKIKKVIIWIWFGKRFIPVDSHASC